MTSWRRYFLSELLRRSEEPAVCDPDQEYTEVTIRLWGKGVSSRGKVSGAEVTSPRNIVRTNQLILSKIDARNGAIGLVPPELDGAIVSKDFPSFEFRDTSVCDPHFMSWLVRSSMFIELCKAASEGTTNRIRIREDRLLSQQIDLPPLEEQRRLVAVLDALADKLRQAEKQLQAIEQDAEELLRSYIFSTPAGSVAMRSMSELLTLRQPDVRVDPLTNYRFAGVYSFGRGVFAGPVKQGAEFSYERLSTLRTGDFVFPKLMAWEGALGVVPPECDGLVVSPEFPVFTVHTDRVLPEVLDVYFRAPSVWPQIAGISGGTNVRRRRVQPSAFLSYLMPVPAMAVQTKLRALYQKVRTLKNEHQPLRKDAAAVLAATLERVFSGP